jgi:hypothetical protein
MRNLLVALMCVLLSICAAHAAPPGLSDVISFPSLSVPQGQTVDVPLPPLPAKPGKITVLYFRAFTVAGGPGGCNWNMSLKINGQLVPRFTGAGSERLVGRAPSLQLTREKLGFSVFGGDKQMIMYAKDADQADSMTTDNMGASFPLDVTDLVRGVDGNTVSFTNLFPGTMPAGQGQLQVSDLQVGYLDRSKLPVVESQAPKRGSVAGGISSGKLKLAQSCSGGFVLRYGNGPELLVETGVGMKPETPSALVAEDNTERSADLSLKCYAPVGNTVDLLASWPGLKLERSLRLDGGLLRWHEKWTNTSDKLRGVPFAHRFFLRDQSTRFWVGGSSDNCSLTCSPANPTMFIQPAGSGNGYGITAESDWLKLLAGWRGMSDLGEVYSNWLALEPGKSIEFELSITPVSDGGGYWSFLNSLRRRWDVNRTTMPAPMFWGFSRVTGGAPEENIKKALGHLGPAIITIGPWQRLEPDARTVTAQRYPKLPPEAPRAPGLTPDFDVNAFLTFAHREPYWQEVKTLTDQIHRTCPQAKVIEMIHPAMEAIYLPLQDRWPIAPDVIKTEKGESMNEPGYSRSWVGDMTKKDWGVLYYCPHEGGPELKAIVDGIRRGMDDCKLDGIYSDEFSFAFASRGYSRYDYSRKDGYSADLDEAGNVVRQKADNGWMSQAAQLQILDEIATRGKFFLGNGGNVLSSTIKLPFHRFIEGGNGSTYWGQGHLSAVPLVLGNMGDEKTTKGIFDSVKLCLQYGGVYSPMAVNLLLEGSDNFVCKQYPLTVQELGPGFVIGRERIITTVSRDFDWPGVSGKARLYRYDSSGKRIETDAEATVRDGKLSLTVPQGGLVIAERR